MIDPELQSFHKFIFDANRPEEVFGGFSGDLKERLVQASRLFHQMARLVHPDKFKLLEDQKLAHVSFSRLNTFYTQCVERLKEGTYGTTKVAPKKSSTPAMMKSKRGLYVIKSGLIAGDVSKIYMAEFEGQESVLIKISKHHLLNELLEKEAITVAHLNETSKGTRSYKKFIPTLLDTFTIKLAPDNSIRRVNVFKPADGFRTLTDVMAQYPEGVDPRHFVWIFNRLLTVLSFAHGQGIVHGAILPPHVMIHPESHAIHLVDWCFSVPRGNYLSVIPNNFQMWYPPEVTHRTKGSPNINPSPGVDASTDIYMAAMCMGYILGADYGEMSNLGKVPPKFRRLLESCLIRNPARRPTSAWELYKELQVISEEVYGPRRYLKLQMA